MALRQQMRLYIACSKSCTHLDQTLQKNAPFAEIIPGSCNANKPRRVSTE